MGTFGPVHGLIIGVWFALFVYPISRIVGKAGYSRWWAIAACLPIFNFIALWAFALSKWPVERD